MSVDQGIGDSQCGPDLFHGGCKNILDDGEDTDKSTLGSTECSVTCIPNNSPADSSKSQLSPSNSNLNQNTSNTEGSDPIDVPPDEAQPHSVLTESKPDILPLNNFSEVPPDEFHLVLSESKPMIHPSKSLIEKKPSLLRVEGSHKLTTLSDNQPESELGTKEEDGDHSTNREGQNEQGYEILEPTKDSFADESVTMDINQPPASLVHSSPEVETEASEEDSNDFPLNLDSDSDLLSELSSFISNESLLQALEQDKVENERPSNVKLVLQRIAGWTVPAIVLCGVIWAMKNGKVNK